MTVASTCKRRAKQIKSGYAQLAGNRHRPIYRALIKAARSDLTPRRSVTKLSASA